MERKLDQKNPENIKNIFLLRDFLPIDRMDTLQPPVFLWTGAISWEFSSAEDRALLRHVFNLNQLKTEKN